MKIRKDGNAVFVADDGFVNLQKTPAVFGSCHDFCVAAAVGMVADDAIRHVSFVTADDTDQIDFKAGGKILKVTIEFVDESESDPEKHKDL